MDQEKRKTVSLCFIHSFLPCLELIIGCPGLGCLVHINTHTKNGPHCIHTLIILMFTCVYFGPRHCARHLYTLFSLILLFSPWDKYYYTHFTDKKTKVQWAQNLLKITERVSSWGPDLYTNLFPKSLSFSAISLPWVVMGRENTLDSLVSSYMERELRTTSVNIIL